MTSLCGPYFQETNGRISLFKEHTNKSRLVPFISNVSEVNSDYFPVVDKVFPALEQVLVINHTRLL